MTVKRLGAEMAAQRRRRRSETRARIQGNPLTGRITFFGKDSKGRPVQTNDPSYFGMQINGWFVRTKFHRDDVSSIITPNNGDSEKQEERYIVPITEETDIFHAVRMYMHIQENYEHELARTKLIEIAEEVNAILAIWEKKFERGDIEDAIRKLEKIEGALENKKSLSKTTALEKLRNTIEILETMTEEENSSKWGIMKADAASSLVAFRERFENWRTEQAIKIKEKARLKECSLRKLRDMYMKAVLESLIVLCKSRVSAEKRINDWRADRALAIMVDKSNIKKINDKSELAYKVVPILRQLVRLRPQRTFRDQATKIGTFLQAGKVKQVKSRIKRLYLHLCSDKPAYFAKQIQKTGDEYLTTQDANRKSFVDYLKLGAASFESKDFDTAAQQFTKALGFLY